MATERAMDVVLPVVVVLVVVIELVAVNIRCRFRGFVGSFVLLLFWLRVSSE